MRKKITSKEKANENNVTHLLKYYILLIYIFKQSMNLSYYSLFNIVLKLKLYLD